MILRMRCGTIPEESRDSQFLCLVAGENRKRAAGDHLRRTGCVTGPDSADAYAVLGYAQYSADHPREAIQSWKKSLALRPDFSIRQMLARAQREKYCGE